MSGSASTETRQRLAAAQDALLSGDLAGARRACEAVLEVDPRNAQAHLILGMAVTRQGLPSDAIEHLLRAHELEPEAFDPLFSLALAYRLAGDPASAVMYGEKALRLNPDLAPVHAELGWAYLSANRLTEAEIFLLNAARFPKPDSRVLMNLGRCLDAQGRPAEAAVFFQRALGSSRATIDELVNMSKGFLQQECRSGALETAREALSRAPKSALAKAQLAHVLVAVNRSAEAAEMLDAPDLARTEDPEALILVGATMRALGRIDEARRCFRRVIERQPSNAAAHVSFAYCGKVRETERDWVEAMAKHVLHHELDPANLAQFHFALGKAHDDLGNPHAAMEHFDAANMAEHTAKYGGAPFNRDRFTASIDQTISILSRPLVEARDTKAARSELPVFVVGMIRSGTSLLEQILSSHPQIGGVGEEPFWSRNDPDIINLRSATVDTDRLRIAAGRYLALIESLSPGNARIVDKLLSNCNSLGLIHAGFPDARIVHVRRNPLDTCLSMYTTANRASPEFAHDKSDLVFGYRQYERLMAHWRAILPPNRFLEINYEDMVANTESTARQLIAYLGLEWDDACLRPEDNERIVATPSSWQVRQPVYSSSVERWRKFEPWLGELMSLSKPAQKP